IFYPFDYPISWLRRGHHFNESYILRAFLQFNSHFRITVWNDWLRWQPVDVPDPLHLPADVVASSFWMERCK
ncbi:MAG: class I SAM-dependent methyltransferase, partial [Planctomycetota bacterium]